MASSYDPDEDFDQQVKVHHEERRTLIAKRISPNASREEFESACRLKLSNPDTVIFNWNMWSWECFTGFGPHQGCLLLHFESQPDAEKALEELQDFELRNHKIKVIKFAPLSPTPKPVDSTAPNLDTTTPGTEAEVGVDSSPELGLQWDGTFKGGTNSDTSSISSFCIDERDQGDEKGE